MEWIKVENLQSILDEFKPKILSPDDPDWQQNWKNLRGKLINGIWVEQFGKWRYVSGRLGWYGVFYRFEDWVIENGQKLRVKNCIPRVGDIEWHRAYNHMEMQGFSGFTLDNNNSSDIILTNLKKYSYVEQQNPIRWGLLKKKNGKFKEYISPRENLLGLHDYAKGHAMYYNPSKNNIEMTCRGSGKSHQRAGAIILYDIVFGNLTYYEPTKANPKSSAIIEVTSAGGGKAKELLDKVKEGMDALADRENPELGVWEYSNEHIEPCPFWKRMSGSYSANNKEKGGWKAIKSEHKDDLGNWTSTFDNAIVYNTTYSNNSRSGGTKSAGGRRTYVINEEFGENELIDISWSANNGLISESGNQMAPQDAIGTSSLNEDIIMQAQVKFLNARANNCLEFEYPYLNKPACFFIPAYMSDRKYKDKDGNTDIEASRNNQEQILNDLIESGADQIAINGHKVNYPNSIDDMFIQAKDVIMPSHEAAARLKALYRNPVEPTYIELYKDLTKDYGIGYKKLEPHQVFPFREFPYFNRKNFEGAIEMFIEPKQLYIGNVIPQDAVWVFVDPYKEGDWDKGGSLGAVIVWVNPKYIDFGLPANQIAATYFGKPKTGIDGFVQIISDLHYFYGNGIRNVWYEDNIGGEEIRFKFIKEQKIDALCLRPQFKQGNHIFVKNNKLTGYKVSTDKNILWSQLANLFKSPQLFKENNQEWEDLIINKISSLFLLNQIREGKGNLDAVSALQALPLALGEQAVLNTYTKVFYNPLANSIKKRLQK